MKQIITIDEKTVEVDGKQYKLVEVTPERKEPSWAEVFRKGEYTVSSLGARCLTERVARKAATFMKIAMLAEYLCPGYVPDYSSTEYKYGIAYLWEYGLFTSCYRSSSNGTELFNSKATAQRAIEIFRANGDEQELIEFLTK